MKPLTAREWLERERLSGLPHADFAAEALASLDEFDERKDDEERLYDRLFAATGDMIESDDQVVDTFEFRNAVLTVLTDAGVIDDDVTGDQAADLLRMFLPAG